MRNWKDQHHYALRITNYALKSLALRDKVLLIVETFIGNVLVENHETNQIRNRHQAVHRVRKIPHDVERLRRADKSYAAENKSVSVDDFAVAHEIFQRFFAVIFPAENRRICEKSQSD